MPIIDLVEKIKSPLLMFYYAAIKRDHSGDFLAMKKWDHKNHKAKGLTVLVVHASVLARNDCPPLFHNFIIVIRSDQKK